MTSFCGDTFFGRFLPLLGFEDGDKILPSKDLFIVPNKDAFQKVSFFQTNIKKKVSTIFCSVLNPDILKKIALN
jgi:hypothetical protein